MKYWIYHKPLFSARFGKFIGIETMVSREKVEMSGFQVVTLTGEEAEFKKIERLLALEKDPELLTTVISDRTIEDLIHKIKGTKAAPKRDSNWEQNIGEYRV